MGRTHRILHALPITGFVAEVHERLNTCDPIEPEHTIDQFTAILKVLKLKISTLCKSIK